MTGRELIGGGAREGYLGLDANGGFGNGRLLRRKGCTTAALPHDLLRAMFDAAIAAALPSLRVPAWLPDKPTGRTIVVGAGKASAAMAKAV